MKMYKFFSLALLMLASFITAQNKSVAIVYEMLNPTEANHQIATKIKKLGEENGVQVTLFNRLSPEFKDNNAALNNSLSKLNPNFLIEFGILFSDNVTKTGGRIDVASGNPHFDSSLQIANKIKNSYGGNFFGEINTIDSNNSEVNQYPSIKLFFGNMMNESDRNFIDSPNGQEEIAQRLFKAIYVALN